MRKLFSIALALVLLFPIIPFPNPVAHAISATVTSETEFRAALANAAVDEIKLNATAINVSWPTGMDARPTATATNIQINRTIDITVEGSGNVIMMGFDVAAGGNVKLGVRAEAIIFKNDGIVNVEGGTLRIVNDAMTAGSGQNNGEVYIYNGNTIIDTNTSTGKIYANGGISQITTNQSGGQVRTTAGDTTITTNHGSLTSQGGVAHIDRNSTTATAIVNGGRLGTQLNEGIINVASGDAITIKNDNVVNVNGGVAYVKTGGAGFVRFFPAPPESGGYITADRMVAISGNEPVRLGGTVDLNFPDINSATAPPLNMVLDPGNSTIKQGHGSAHAYAFFNASVLNPTDTVTIDPSIHPNTRLEFRGAPNGSKFQNNSTNDVVVNNYTVPPGVTYTVGTTVTTSTPTGGTTSPTPSGSTSPGTTPTPSGGGTGTGSDPNSIALDITSRELELGESCQLNASSALNNASNGIGWSSSNPQVATVNRFGLVTATGLGKAVITAAVFDPNDASKLYTASCEITVTQKIKGFRINPTSMTLFVGESKRTSTSLNPPMSTTLEIASYTSSNDEIATADNSGVIMGISPGIAVITATLVDSVMPNHTFTASCVVTVRQSIPVTSIALDANVVRMPSRSRARLSATVTPINYSSPNNIEWSSDNPYVATVDDFGRITAYHGGTAYITASLTDSGNFGRVLTAVCQINVTDRAFGMQVDGIDSEGDVEVGQTFTLTPMPIPSNAKGKWQWNYDTAAFDATPTGGLTLTAKKAGSYLFSATFTDFLGNKMRQSWPVNVISRIRALRIFVPPLVPAPLPTPDADGATPAPTATPTPGVVDFDTMRVPRLNIGDALPLRAVITPGDTSQPEVRWTSSDDNLLTVSNNGLITALRPGMVTIRATSLADESIYDEVIFTVLPQDELAAGIYGIPWTLIGIGGGALLLLIGLVSALMHSARKNATIRKEAKVNDKPKPKPKRGAPDAAGNAPPPTQPSTPG